MKTQAVLFTAPNQIAVAEVVLPPLGDHDVLIRTDYSFISTGTERWTLQGRMALRWGGGFKFPIVPGYQKVGRIEQVGAAVTHFKTGQRVFMTTGRVEGATSGWGGHSQYALQHEGEVYELPAALPGEEAAGLVVVEVGYNTGYRPALNKGDLAIVIGDGIIGQFTAQALKARGAEVWLAGHRPMRLEMARRWSAQRALDTRAENLLDAVRAARPAGADIVVETVSRPEETPAYVQMLRGLGQLVIAGYHPDPNLVDLSPVQDKQITIHSTGGWTRPNLEATMAAIVKKEFQVAPLITHHAPWREAARAYERLVRDSIEDSLGIVIDWR